MAPILAISRSFAIFSLGARCPASMSSSPSYPLQYTTYMPGGLCGGSTWFLSSPMTKLRSSLSSSSRVRPARTSTNEGNASPSTMARRVISGMVTQCPCTSSPSTSLVSLSSGMNGFPARRKLLLAPASKQPHHWRIPPPWLSQNLWRLRRREWMQSAASTARPAENLKASRSAMSSLGRGSALSSPPAGATGAPASSAGIFA
eukprot:CAMPEP_0182854680 /NCGR_PEP_ID=MMETSP0034_2-20130328/1400_1 /TAXON_ID=156128 /ORGANISM="Nephroselmis pyriformis, Strain CCMP717" /LENGTH=202 /DNA_ID=CAMNT_0024985545 /DNA_START=327 /DNA_END=932 /DNA_ORIENTATION=+